MRQLRGDYPLLASNKYKYNGKELETFNNFETLDYGARMYDSAISRFYSFDNSSENYYSQTPYNYVGNNPIKRVDPDGNDWWDTVVGTAIGVVINVVPGSTSLRNSYTPTDAADYNSALRNTDAAAMVVGEGMVKGGSGAIASGLAVAAVAGTASLALVDAPLTVTVAAGGIVLMANGAANTSKGYNYGGQKDTKSGSSKEAFRNAKDQNGIPRSQQPNKTIKPNTLEGNAAKLDGRNVKQYEFTNSQGQKVTIRQNKPATYNVNGTGDQGAHYNAGQNGGKLKQHHNYGN